MILFLLIFISSDVFAEVRPTAEQKACSLATSILNANQTEKDDIEAFYIPARTDDLKKFIEVAHEGIFKKLQKAQLPVHTRGEDRDRICKAHPTKPALVEEVRGKDTLILCAPPQSTAAVVDAFLMTALGALQFNGKNSKAEALMQELLVVNTPAGKQTVNFAQDYKMPLSEAYLLQRAVQKQKREAQSLPLLEGPTHAQKKVFQPDVWLDSPFRTLISLGEFSVNRMGGVEWRPAYEAHGGQTKFEEELARELLHVRCESAPGSNSRHVLCPFRDYKDKQCVSRVLSDCLQAYADEALEEIEKRRKYSSKNEEVIKTSLTSVQGLACASLLEFCAEKQRQALRSTLYYLRFVRAIHAGLKRDCVVEAVRSGLGNDETPASMDAALASLDKILNIYKEDGWEGFHKAVSEHNEARSLEKIYASYFSALNGYNGLTAQSCKAPQSEPVCRRLLHP